MSIHEATLYGDLVRFLRDACAGQLAGLKGTTVEVERQELDALIRAWFFTPQDDLYGFTPQRVIRNEELGLRNIISSAHKHELFFDDCPVCQEMRELEEEGLGDDDDGGWGFGLAPDTTLLDEYDPEGYDERWRIEDERMQAHLAQIKAEAQELPFTGADDPELALQVERARRLLNDDSPF
ncbi:MAG: hypothetical protein K1X65_24090 [Caldilineales bacterium]|nr:hypothetical protein [Caldilineales bacterium]MCW5858137.1 hypothetical protein [Caldilineales bacterium]